MTSETHSQPGWPQPYRLLDAEPYWQGLEQELLKYQRCAGCARSVWPAHSRCPHCGSSSLTWNASSGRGTIYSHSTVMRGPTPVWNSIAPYTIGFIEMEEGYFLFAEIDVSQEALKIGEPVQVRFVRRGAQVLPVFDLAKQG